MLENRPEDALVSLVETVETVQTVETVETEETVETVETGQRSRYLQTYCPLPEEAHCHLI